MPDPRLWICNPCNMIGEDADAERHVTLTGHRVNRLTQRLSDSIRAEWAETGDLRAKMEGSPHA